MKLLKNWIFQQIKLKEGEMKIFAPQNLLSYVEDFYGNDKFSELPSSFSYTFLLYLEKWSNTFLPLNAFRWTLLKNPLVWEEIQHNIEYIADVDQNIMKIVPK
jgi:hypothetical protein